MMARVPRTGNPKRKRSRAGEETGIGPCFRTVSGPDGIPSTPKNAPIPHHPANAYPETVYFIRANTFCSGATMPFLTDRKNSFRTPGKLTNNMPPVISSQFFRLLCGKSYIPCVR